MSHETMPQDGVHADMPTKPDTAQQTLDKLIAGYVQRLPGKLDAIRAAARPLHSGIDTRHALHELQTLVHKLAGSAGAYNCAAVGTAARSCEILIDACLESGTEPGCETLDLLGKKLAGLEKAVSLRMAELITP